MNNFPSSAPAYQPTSRPRNQSIAYTEFLYVSLALILLIVLICLIMCGLKRLCHKKVSYARQYAPNESVLLRERLLILVRPSKLSAEFCEINSLICMTASDNPCEFSLLLEYL